MPTGQQYSSTTAQTSITSSISNVATSINVSSAASFPSTPFSIALDIGNSNQELCDVTNVVGTTFTVTRGIDSSSAVAHSNGATVTHIAIGRDFREMRSHIDASSSNDASGEAVHGLATSSHVVGTTDTQTLTNKTLTAPVLGGTTTGTYTLGGSPTITGGALSGTFTSNETIITPAVSTEHPLTLTAATNSTADLFRIKNDSGVNVFDVGANGTGHMGNVTISPDETAQTPLIVNAPASSAGNLLDIQLNGVSKWKVANNNNLTSTGSNTALDLTAMIGGAKPIIGPHMLAYSPSWTSTGTAPSVGNGSLAGGYIQYGQITHVETYLQWGSTTSGGSGGWSISLPLAVFNFAHVEGWILRSGVTFYKVFGAQVSSGGTTAQLYEASTHASLTATAPATFGTGDILFLTADYQATT